ncbi:MAG: site-2 protease family protein [Desulfobacterales bacterium]
MNLPIPYIPDFQNFAMDHFVAFLASLLLAVMVNAEGQAFAATALGDAQNSPKRFHFNAFLHLDIWGAICFFLAGFGWPRKVDIDASRFSSPRFFTFLVRMAGPMSNFLLASIAGSVVWLMGKYGVEDRVFSIVMIVNASVAAYSLIPIPPLAGASLFTVFTAPQSRFLKYLENIGSALLVLIFLAERFAHLPLLSPLLNPAVTAIVNFIKS